MPTEEEREARRATDRRLDEIARRLRDAHTSPEYGKPVGWMVMGVIVDASDFFYVLSYTICAVCCYLLISV